MKKKLMYLLFLVCLIIAIVAIYYSWNSYKESGLYGESISTINGKGTFPYKKDVDPKIAVIDTGIYLDNEYLSNANISQKYTDDFSQTSQQFHGTMVSGILVSDGNGHTEPGGLIPKANILSIQSGNDFGMSSRQLASAIELAVKENVDIINISLATPKDSKELRKAVNKALSENILIVASVGNNDEVSDFYPAAYEGVIGVGAIDNDMNVIEDPNPNNVDIYAVGKHLLTTNATDNKPQANFTGSSAAAPVVTSTISVIKTEFPHINNKEIVDVLTQSSNTKNYKNKDIHILNINQALEKAKSLK